MTSSALELILQRLSAHKQTILNLARMAMEKEKYEDFRTMFLNEFGDRGFEGELVDLIAKLEWTGMGGNIHAGEEV